jgi:hypothetical protein
MANLKEFVSEIAGRCNDISFKDFSKAGYYNALYRANREIARKYHIFQKLINFRLGDRTQDLSKDIIFDLPDMEQPIVVTVNNTNLRKKDFQLLPGTDEFAYYFFRNDDGLYLFNYILGKTTYPQTNFVNADLTEYMNTSVSERDSDDPNAVMYGKNANDNVSILYQSIPERDSDESEFVIPSKYEEEQIDRAVIHIAKIGIAKFNEEKLDKYTRIFRLYSKNSDFNKEFNETKEPIIIQPFQYP